MARAPRLSISRALPASQQFASTRIFGPLCRRRNSAALFFCDAMNSPMCDYGCEAAARRVGRPEMLRGIGAPGPPGLGAILQFGRARPRAVARGAAQQADVAGRKGIGLPHGAQRDVMRRPFADAADRPQPRHGFLDAGQRLEQVGIGKRGLCQRRQRRLPRSRHAQRCEIGGSHLRRRRKSMGQRGVAALRRRQRPCRRAAPAGPPTAAPPPPSPAGRGSRAWPARSRPSRPARAGPAARRSAAPAAGPAPDGRRFQPHPRRDRTPAAPAR